MTETLVRTPARGPHLPAAARRSPRTRWSPTRASTTTPSATGRASGRSQALALDWHREWDTILDWQLPFAKWFVGGKLNVSENCLDRHVRAGPRRPGRVALGGRARRQPRRHVSGAARRDVARRRTCCASSVSSRATGSRSTWAWCPRPWPRCSPARASAPRTRSCSAASPRSRSRTGSTTRRRACSITADGAWRRGSVVAAEGHRRRGARRRRRRSSTCVVLRRTESECDDADRAATSGGTTRSTARARECAPESMDAEDLLFILYTSGTTGKPKGIMHTTGGYLTQVAYTHKYVFDLKPDTDVYWCTADVGWVTGHSYIVYGPLANRATSVLYEGTPDHPGKDRLWSIVEKYKVTIFYTAPTAIRTFMKWGDDLPAAHDLSSLRLIGTVGEPINPEAWVWYYGVIGGERCPVVDTWWQTETGAIMISALPGATTLKPGSATFPLPGHRGEHRRRRRASRSGSPAAATSCCRGRGRRCCAASGATRALPRHVLVALRRQVLRGRRRQARRRRLLLAARSRRRHHARRRAQHLDHRGGVRAGRPSVGGRGRGRRSQRRRPPARRSPRSSRCAAASSPATSSSRSCATTSPS